jgi:hypothetical protein
MKKRCESSMNQDDDRRAMDNATADSHSALV